MGHLREAANLRTCGVSREECYNPGGHRHYAPRTVLLVYHILSSLSSLRRAQE